MGICVHIHVFTNLPHAHTLAYACSYATCKHTHITHTNHEHTPKSQHECTPYTPTHRIQTTHTSTCLIYAPSHAHTQHMNSPHEHKNIHHTHTTYTTYIQATHTNLLLHGTCMATQIYQSTCNPRAYSDL